MRDLKECRKVIESTLPFVYTVVGSSMFTSLSTTWALFPGTNTTVRDSVMTITLTSISATLASGAYITGAYGLATNHMTKKLITPGTDYTVMSKYNDGVFSWGKLKNKYLYLSIIAWAFALPIKCIFIVMSLFEDVIHYIRRRVLKNSVSYRKKPARLFKPIWPAIVNKTMCEKCIENL